MFVLFAWHARIQKIFSGWGRGVGGGWGGVQIFRRGLTENFNIAKTNNLAFPGGGGPDPLSRPLDPSMLGLFYAPANSYGRVRTLPIGLLSYLMI